MKRKCDPLLSSSPVKKRDIIPITINDLPGDCLRIIFEFAAPRESHRRLLRFVCKKWNEDSKRLKKCSSSFEGYEFPLRIIWDSACEGLPDLCTYGLNLYDPDLKIYGVDYLLRIALSSAARNGKAVTCFWAKANSATDFGEMIYNAGYNNNVEICALAREWGVRDFTRGIESASKRGHVRLCETLRSWTLETISETKIFASMGQEIANICAIGGARGGHLNVVQKALEWGLGFSKLDMSKILDLALDHDHGEIATIAMERIHVMSTHRTFGGLAGPYWNGREVGMTKAAERGKKNVWIAARILGASAWDESILLASTGSKESLEDRKEICRMAIEHGGIIPTENFYPDFDISLLMKKK